jgi:hypothetical protein
MQVRGSASGTVSRESADDLAPLEAAARGPKLLDVARTRTHEIGPTARPVAVPEDLGDPSLPKATGQVELPLHVRWSGPPTTYDLDDPADRARVYEQVLREGTEDDVRFYIDPDQLADILDELVLPARVREAWAGWLDRHRT